MSLIYSIFTSLTSPLLKYRLNGRYRLQPEIWSLDLVDFQWSLTELRLNEPVAYCSAIYVPKAIWTGSTV